VARWRGQERDWKASRTLLGCSVAKLIERQIKGQGEGKSEGEDEPRGCVQQRESRERTVDGRDAHS
jgi:hypothetical protein